MIDAEGNNLGVLSRDDALKLAQEQGVDLVEIAPLAQPPVARLIQYGKLLYREAKEERKRRSKERKDVMKEVQLGLNTSEHDLGIKASKVREFLAEGLRVDIALRLRGRERFIAGARERAENKLRSFLALVPEAGVSRELRRAPRGFSLTIERKRL